MLTFLDNHRGPFLFLVTRETPTRKLKQRAEWLTGEIDKNDVADEARALLADPRDTIRSINVWSVREDSFVGGYHRRSCHEVKEAR